MANTTLKYRIKSGDIFFEKSKNFSGCRWSIVGLQYRIHEHD